MITPGIKTLDDALAEIRAIINDADSGGYRFPDVLVIQKLNTAMMELRKYRPDAFIGNFTQGVLTNTGVTFFEVTDISLGVAWPVDQNFFFAPIVFYVAGILDLSDDEFADDNRAMTLLSAFKAQLTGPGG